jgi:hypothetical protein
MAFIDIRTLDGAPLLVAADSVFRITLSTPVLAGGALTRIDFGTEHQLTRTGPREIEQALTTLGVKFVELLAPDGTTPIFLSVAAISAVRRAEPGQDPLGSNVAIMVQGQRQTVQQTLAEVRLLLA